MYTCELCLEDCAQDAFLCSACYNELPFPGLACPQCSEPVSSEGRCGKCQKSPPAYDYSHCSLTYHHPLTHWMRQCKEGRDIRMAQRFSDLMMASPPLLTVAPDALVYIPSTRRRRWQRGFNLSEELAQLLSQHTRIPVIDGALIKIRHTEQRQAGAQARRITDAGLRRGPADVSGLHLLIIDDVMTTGSTLQQSAQQLKSAGAAIVGAWCLARTVRAG